MASSDMIDQYYLKLAFASEPKGEEKKKCKSQGPI